MNNASLSLHAVSKKYIQGESSIEVLHNISITFNQGETYAIFGESGSGKSTLLHIIGGLDVPTSGKVQFNETLLSIHQKDHAFFLNKHIGFVFQFHYLIDELTVLENVMLPALIAKTPYEKAKEHALALISSLGIEHKHTSYPFKLSGGEQQRVSIARALSNNPSFLIADEPTGNLDEDRAQEVLDIFLQIVHEKNVGLIICSHDKYIYSRMNRLYKLNHGELRLQNVENALR